MKHLKQSVATGICIVGVVSASPSAAAQSTYDCGSPACDAIQVDPYAARLDAAWKADVTTPEQRDKLAAFVTDYTDGKFIDWKKAADAYFSWRNGKPYVYVEPESYYARQEREYSILRKQVESRILGQLVDPDSAKFEWPFGFINGSWKPDLFSKRISGLLTCGYVNSKNRMGGYTGRMTFAVVINDGTIRHLSIDSPGSELNAMLCSKARLPPL